MFFRQAEFLFKKKTSNLIDAQKQKLAFLLEIPHFKDINEDELFEQVDIKQEIFQFDYSDLYTEQYIKNNKFPNTTFIFDEFKPKIFKVVYFLFFNKYNSKFVFSTVN